MINEDMEIWEFEGDDDYSPEFELLKDVWNLIEDELASRRDEDYEPVPEKMEVVSRVYAFFWKWGKQHNAKIESFTLEPKTCLALFTISGFFLGFTGNDLKELSHIVGEMSVLDIDATLDGKSHMSFNIPGVFRHK